MIHEQEFICWHPKQVEADGKEVMATTIRDAAKKQSRYGVKKNSRLP